ncbi:MAG: serine hydrolase [Lachnospiraceae bacterium]|nr:serine hydrolase [Lachnospiraceae bacterium]
MGNNILKRLAALAVCILLFLPVLNARAENHAIIENLPVYVDGNLQAGVIKTLHYDYAFNRYVSLRDMGLAMNGSGKSFNVSYADETFDIKPGEAYNARGGEGGEFGSAGGAEDPYKTGGLKNSLLSRNGEMLKYSCFTGKNGSGIQDVFVSIADLAMILDCNMWFEADSLYIDSSAPFTVNMERLEAEGFYSEVASSIVGDATTGEVFSSFREDLPVAIASTTKLMSYLLVMEEISAGRLSLDEQVSIPPEAEALSKTSDGVIAMTAGETASVRELITGALLPSSNECVLTLAVRAAGSEAAFVEMMNQKAAELGLSDGCRFYNCHGLPVFTDTLAATKMQNTMSAADMFKLVSHILSIYPQITDITSQKSARLESFSREVKNTNPVLYDLKECVGLKTGTTYAAGACLVSAARVTDSAGAEHTVVAVEFGAEDSTIRCTLSEILLRYGMQRVRGDQTEIPSSAGSTELPRDAESLIRLVLR